VSFSKDCTNGVCDTKEEVNQIDAIKVARANANKLVHPQYTMHQKLALSARILADFGQGETLSGQVSCRGEDMDGDVSMWTGVYGKAFDEYNTKDFIRIVSRAGKFEVVEGTGAPNLATRFHLHVYRNRSDAQCIIHTHPLHTTALSQLGVPLFISHMDHMALYKDVAFLPNWPGVPFGDEEGSIITNVLAPSYHAGLLAHHGMIVMGKTIEEATYRAFFFERAAQVQMEMMAANGGRMDRLPQVDNTLAEIARDWRITEGPVNAHFYTWARMTVKNAQDDFLNA
jgi:L-fuculose-phosphate aldolase